jgi:hypothetical protein
MANPPHSRSTIVAAIAACAGFAMTAVGALVLWVGQHDTQDALCRFAQRSADTKTLMVDTLARAFEVDDTNPFIAEMRAGIAEERSELAGYCPHPTEEP